MIRGERVKVRRAERECACVKDVTLVWATEWMNGAQHMSQIFTH